MRSTFLNDVRETQTNYENLDFFVFVSQKIINVSKTALKKVPYRADCLFFE